MTRLSEKRLVELACSDMEQRPDLWEHESMAAEILQLRAKLLDSPPAMTWQDEPSAIGLHYVEGLSAPVPLIRDANRPDRPWVYWDVKYNRSERVGRRRVCPIPSPPALPKRGEE